MTLTPRHIHTGCRLILPGDLAKHAVAESAMAVQKVYNNRQSNKRQSHQRASGLIISMARVERRLRTKWKNRIAPTAVASLTAIVQYLVDDILSLAGSIAATESGKVIPRHIFITIVMDEALDVFFGEWIIPQGGGVPVIHDFLCQPAQRRSKSKSKWVFGQPRYLPLDLSPPPDSTS